MSRRKGYLAVVLDDASVTKLIARSFHNHVYCHHVTMVYKPTPKQWQKYDHLLGTKVDFVAIGIAEDRRGQAALVKGVLSENVHPHVTIGCSPSTEPVYSNELLERAKRHKRIKRCRIKLSGTVQFIRL